MPSEAVNAFVEDGVIQTARLNDIDPQAWFADMLVSIHDHKITDLAALLPWRWAADMERRKLAA
jgi:transposase